MRRLFSHLALVAVVVLTVSTPSRAEVPVNDRITLDGDVRFRTEISGYEGKTFYDTSYLRTLVGMRLQAQDNLLFRIRIKESRVLGTTPSNEKSSSFLDLQEGYFLVTGILNTPVDFQAGRFEMLYGRRRIMGNGNWNNYGPRTYDGIRFHWHSGVNQAWLFVNKTTERSYADAEDYNPGDRVLVGFAGELFDSRVQPIVLADVDNARYEPAPDTESWKGQRVFTAGVYLPYETGGLTTNLDAAYQFGKRRNAQLYFSDVSAWLLAADATWTFPLPLAPHLGIGADITSGTRLSAYAKREDHTFQAPFMSRHVYRGYMDYFKDVNQGLNELFLRAGLSPTQHSNLDLTLHHFELLHHAFTPDISFKSPLFGDRNYQLGTELDLRLRARLTPGLDLDAAYCHFYAHNEELITNPFAQVVSSFEDDFIYIALTGTF